VKDKKVAIKPVVKHKSNTMGDSSSDEEVKVAPKKKIVPPKRGVMGDSSSDDEKPVAITKPKWVTKKAGCMGDSSSEEEPSQYKEKVVDKIGSNSKEEVIIGNEDSSQKEEDKKAEDNFEKNMKMKPRKESNADSRKTVATGAEATKLMFERQMVQMMKQQDYLQGKSKTNTAEDNKNDESNTQGASLKIMQDSSGKLNIEFHWL